MSKAQILRAREIVTAFLEDSDIAAEERFSLYQQVNEWVPKLDICALTDAEVV